MDVNKIFAKRKKKRNVRKEFFQRIENFSEPSSGTEILSNE